MQPTGIYIRHNAARELLEVGQLCYTGNIKRVIWVYHGKMAATVLPPFCGMHSHNPENQILHTVVLFKDILAVDYMGGEPSSSQLQ
jgi:hypothetical protein